LDAATTGVCFRDLLVYHERLESKFRALFGRGASGNKETMAVKVEVDNVRKFWFNILDVAIQHQFELINVSS
jgi:hypothetical protein